ncbi:MAG: hypothetical protein JXL67_12920 [Calditrichaeota bacterium]|nr:hypothetical protein [Calditrichota bacterium]
MDADTFVYIGTAGLLIGLLTALFMIFRRFRWMARRLRGQKMGSPGIIAGFRNLIFLLLGISVFGTILFAGFFFEAYRTFTLEEPVGEIIIEPLAEKQTSRVTLIEFVSPDSQNIQQYLIRGDQWVIEGDILKWDNWMNFLGLHTRYRLSRIRGRFMNTEDEIRESSTIYSLIEHENEFLWKYLYEYGPELPFVNSVYGNAVFQNAETKKHFLILVTTSGFMTREIPEKGSKTGAKSS